jgi:YggT family protein
MFVLKYLILALAEVIDIVLISYMIIVIARAVISWVNPDPYNPRVVFLFRVTEPVLRPVRRLPLLRGMTSIDLSPFIIILIIIFLQIFLVQTMRHVAQLL